MTTRKFSKVYMLDVKANKSGEEVIDYLMKSLVVAINKKLYKTSKVSLNIMDREDQNGK